MSRNNAAAFFQICPQTVTTRVQEMQATGRYGRFTIEDGQLVRINILALADYLTHRQEIRAGITPEPYDPIATRRALGWL